MSSLAIFLTAGIKGSLMKGVWIRGIVKIKESSPFHSAGVGGDWVGEGGKKERCC